MRRSTDVLKMAEKSKFSAIVHAQYMNSSLVSNYACKKKEKKKRKENTEEENADTGFN